MAKYDAVLFDVDGTLLDSAPGILGTLRRTFAQMGADVPESTLRRYLGPPLRASFGEWFSDGADVEKAVALYRADYHARGSHECLPYPGAAEMLRRLQQGGVRLYTATCKPVHVVEPMLAEQGLRGFFTRIGGASPDASAETKTAVIRSLLDLPELQGCRVLMAGDRADDLQGAAACGIPAAAVLYGYGSAAELAPLPCVFAARCPQELTQFVLDGETQ